MSNDSQNNTSNQELRSDPDGNIKPLQGMSISGSRSTDTWRQDVMRILRKLGVKDNTTA